MASPKLKCLCCGDNLSILTNIQFDTQTETGTAKTMKATELLEMQMEFSKQSTMGLLADLADAPLTAPTADGGNHPLWVAGHLVYSEAGLVNYMALGKPNPLEDWKPIFGRGTQPEYDAAHYPVTIPEILAKWDEVRQGTLEELDKLTEADLETPAANFAPERAAMFGTVGRVFSAVATHPLMHRGQLADARLVLGRAPLQA